MIFLRLKLGCQTVSYKPLMLKASVDKSNNFRWGWTTFLNIILTNIIKHRLHVCVSAISRHLTFFWPDCGGWWAAGK